MLTAAHIVPDGPKGGDAVEVTFYQAATWPRPAGPPVQGDVIARMPTEDLAVIRLVQTPPAVVAIAPKQDPPRGVPYPLAVLAAGCDRQGAPELWVDRVGRHRPVHKPDGARALYWEAERAPDLRRASPSFVLFWRSHDVVVPHALFPSFPPRQRPSPPHPAPRGSARGSPAMGR